MHAWLLENVTSIIIFQVKMGKKQAPSTGIALSTAMKL